MKMQHKFIKFFVLSFLIISSILLIGRMVVSAATAPNVALKLATSGSSTLSASLTYTKGTTGGVDVKWFAENVDTTVVGNYSGTDRISCYPDSIGPSLSHLSDWWIENPISPVGHFPVTPSFGTKNIPSSSLDILPAGVYKLWTLGCNKIGGGATNIPEATLTIQEASTPIGQTGSVTVQCATDPVSQSACSGTNVSMAFGRGGPGGAGGLDAKSGVISGTSISWSGLMVHDDWAVSATKPGFIITSNPYWVTLNSANSYQGTSILTFTQGSIPPPVVPPIVPPVVPPVIPPIIPPADDCLKFTASGPSKVTMPAGATFRITSVTDKCGGGSSSSSDWSVVGEPYQFEPSAGRPSIFAGYNYNIAIYNAIGSSEKRLMVGQNFGYTIHTLSNPVQPSPIAQHNMITQGGGGPLTKGGDGQTTVENFTVAPDGSRAIISWRDSPHGTLLMKAEGNAFKVAGDFAGYRASATAIIKKGASYVGYDGNTSAMFRADITNFITDTTPRQCPGSTSIQPFYICPNTISVTGVSSPSAGKGVQAGRYFVYQNTLTGAPDKIVVIDGETDIVTTIPNIKMDPSGKLDVRSTRITATADPADPTAVYIFAMMKTKDSTYPANTNPKAIGVVRLSPSGVTTVPGSPFPLPTGYDAENIILQTAFTNGNDAVAVFWQAKNDKNDGTTPNLGLLVATIRAGKFVGTSPNIAKEYTITSTHDNNGQVVVSGSPFEIVTQVGTNSASATDMVGYGDGKNAYLYVAVGMGAKAFKLAYSPIITTSGAKITYAWDFGDSLKGIGSNLSHYYQKAGTFITKVIATSPSGKTAFKELTTIVTAGAGGTGGGTGDTGGGTDTTNSGVPWWLKYYLNQ